MAIVDTKYSALVPRQPMTGTLMVSKKKPQFAYLKIADEMVIDIYNKFKEICSDNTVEIVPCFANSKDFENPVGAHITIVNTGVFSFISTARILFDKQDTKYEFTCDEIKEVVPKHWKTMEKVWVCTVNCPPLLDLYKELCIDLAPDQKFHFTFAVKREEEVEAIERPVEPPKSRHDYLDEIRLSSRIANRFDDCLNNAIDRTIPPIERPVEPPKSRPYYPSPDDMRQSFRTENIFSEFSFFKQTLAIEDFLRICENEEIKEKEEVACRQAQSAKVITESTSEDKILGYFEAMHNRRFYSLDQIKIAYRKGYDKLLDLILERLNYGTIARDDHYLIVDSHSHTILTLPASEYGIESNSNKPTIEEMAAINSIMLLPTSKINANHIQEAYDKGFSRVLDYILKMCKFRIVENLDYYIVFDKNSKQVCTLFKEASFLNFNYKDVSDAIQENDDELEALKDLAIIPKNIFRHSHIEEAEKKGFEKAADFIQDAIDLEEAAEQPEEDAIYSDSDDIEVPTRTLGRKNRDEVKTLIYKHRTDDLSLLKKMHRVDPFKLTPQHVKIAEKQRLDSTAAYIRQTI